VSAGRLHLHVSDEDLAERRAAWVPPEPAATRGYTKLYVDHVLQANEGADLDFLVGRSGAAVPRDNH
jgi:L-arabonate dehydrase